MSVLCRRARRPRSLQKTPASAGLITEGSLLGLALVESQKLDGPCVSTKTNPTRSREGALIILRATSNHTERFVEKLNCIRYGT